MPPSKALTKLLASPSKVAQSLDWRKVSGSVLSMNITRDRINLAVAQHPSMEDPIQTLPSIPIKTEIVSNQRVLSPAVANELKSLLDNWRVCGLVVNWPVQKEGWCGAPCGRVLFTLDQLAANDVLNPQRPLCLWDDEHTPSTEDEWGRTPIYAQPSDKTLHRASEEQYQAPNKALADIWNDFCRAHWPELYYHVGASSSSSGKTSSTSAATSKKNPPPPSVDTAWFDSYEDTSAYTKASM